jgi:hypothetical protein
MPLLVFAQKLQMVPVIATMPLLVFAQKLQMELRHQVAWFYFFSFLIKIQI